jgi:hypothetical protein
MFDWSSYYRRIFSRRVSITRFGWMADPHDSRDRMLAAAELPDTVPDEYRPTHGLAPRSQAGNSCTGSMALAFQIGEVNHGRRCPRLSGLDAYWKGRFLTGMHQQDEGAYIRDVIKAAIKFGVAPEELWPESRRLINRTPSWLAQRSAHKLRGVRGYYRVAKGDVDGIRKGIANGWAYVGGVKVDDAFRRYYGSEVVEAPTQGKYPHCIILDGFYSNGNFDSLNSWGSWRRDGRVQITEAFAAMFWDGWIVVTG